MAQFNTLEQKPALQGPPPIFGNLPGGGGGPSQRFTQEKKRAKDARGTILRIWHYLRKQRLALIITGLSVVVTTGATLLGTYLLGRAIDGFILKGDMSGLFGLCLLMLGIYALNSVLTWLQSFLMAGAAQRTVRDLRNDLFGRLQVLPLRTFDTRAHGDLMSRLTNDVENINLVLSDVVTQIVSALLTSIGVIIAMLAINPLLTVICLTTITSMSLLVNRFIAPRTRSGFRQQQAALGTLNSLIEETISGQRVVKAYHREEVISEEFDEANLKLRQVATRAQIFAGFIGPMMNLVNNLGLAIVAGVGGWFAFQGMASVGTIAVFINYTRQFGRPLNDIANLYNTIQAAIAGAERVFEIIDEPAEVDALDALPLERIKGDVVFEEVSFGYEPGVPVLKNVSLHARPGQTVALVGPTGAGKTTIVNLLTRFYELAGGRVTIDGQDLHDIRKEELRRQLGIVLQDTYLFSGTVMDNIRYGRLDATEEEVKAAARLANADQFIHRLPHGYNTPLSERGSNLSQGQRQLLAIARAILADPGILILDEATSSVDTRTEQHIQEAMLRLMEGRTSFVIAHRLSTIRSADQILVINGGEILERGTHEELLAKQGFYAGLHASQF